MQVVVGHSEDSDSERALQEVLAACLDSLAGVIPQAGLLFAGIDHDFQHVLDGIMGQFPDLELIGCTTDGELSSSLGFVEDSLVLMLFQSDSVQFKAGVGAGIRDNPGPAAEQAFAMASEDLDLPIKLCIATPDGLVRDPSSVLAALAATVDPDIPICGGFAADQMRIEGTYQFFKGTVYSDAIPVLLFAGPLVLSAAYGSGYQPIGEAHQVTKASGSVVHTIDGRPAHDFCLSYYGSLDFSANQSFAVYTRSDDLETRPDDFYISGPLSFNDDGSMTVLLQIPEGAFLRHAFAKRDEILAGAEQSIRKVTRDYKGIRPDAALIFSCAGRHQLLGTRTAEEAALLKMNLGDDIPAIGFYTFGEICPLADGSQQSHSSTFVTVLIGES